ncbi:hypothetical protein QVD17_01822 [Tagetes erecta]|uniref:Uncharacterized protein n=1 Tax=Tagetes erecta TaxID=13708 RepID=A0AAD8LCU1_TARER|nr:hypothetical protein QVD17_01822 [Tagetes erecta]
MDSVLAFVSCFFFNLFFFSFHVLSIPNEYSFWFQKPCIDPNHWVHLTKSCKYLDGWTWFTVPMPEFHAPYVDG